ncbi:hypothetical protein AB1Y20_017479 [Prymnesium parvum]|uniref:Uncharacterized protein n=1 Tax=Prymnesium parvum TaxID=97485 RepID=A0AB34JMB8_PRYPA
MACARTPGHACAGTLMPQPLNMTLLTSTIAQPHFLGYHTRFVKVNDWGLNISALREQAEDILKRSGAWGRAHSYLTTRARVPAVEQLLHNATLANIIQEYLGGPARFDGYAT